LKTPVEVTDARNATSITPLRHLSGASPIGKISSWTHGS
jgi:hypothetical protein